MARAIWLSGKLARRQNELEFARRLSANRGARGWFRIRIGDRTNRKGRRRCFVHRRRAGVGQRLRGYVASDGGYASPVVSEHGRRNGRQYASIAAGKFLNLRSSRAAA